MQMNYPRPYRSHKVPACDRCRRFKRRCTGGSEDQPCVLCNLQNAPCQYSDRPKVRTVTSRSLKRVQPKSSLYSTLESPHPTTDGEIRPDNIGSDYHGSPNQDQPKVESMVASPVISEDIQILERYMSSKLSSMVSAGQAHVTTSTSGNPAVYLKVPRRREGLAIAENPGKRQKEILWQIVRPYADELVRLYFQHIHPAFPILDEQSFLELYKSGGDKLSPALTCEFFALSLILWQHSDSLKHFQKPDPQFIWNLAVEALQQDFLAPGLSTVYSVILDMIGRPIYSVLGNTINNGRAVSLAQSLGLNRDPTHWRRSAREKALRIRLWWAILIHDRWSSFAHGIPPSTTSNQYDVPVPTLTDILTKDHQLEKHIKAAECFIRLCTLSIILGEALPLVYDLKIDQSDTWKRIRRLETSLDEWEVNLPPHLQQGIARIPGSSSLHLGYLSVRLLLSRIALHAATISDGMDRLENTRYHLSRLRDSAQGIVDYVCSLNKAQLQDFWLPYAAHHLTLTVIILLRCTVESTGKNVIESCKLSLTRFWTKLQDAAENEGWDLANICITRCAESVSKIMSLPVDLHGKQGEGQEPDEVDPNQEAVQAVGTALELIPDILPFSNPDISFDSEWDASLYGLGWMGTDDLSSYEEINNGLFQV